MNPTKPTMTAIETSKHHAMRRLELLQKTWRIIEDLKRLRLAMVEAAKRRVQ